MSWTSVTPGGRATTRLFPEEGDTAQSISTLPGSMSRGENQISPVRGCQARPAAKPQPELTVRFLPVATSKTTTEDASFTPPRRLSIAAISRPSGEKRGKDRTACSPGVPRTLPIGNSSFPSRIAASPRPSGDQSANPAPSRISRGAPPASDTSASVSASSRSSATASFPEEEIAERSALGSGNAVVSELSARVEKS